MSAEPHPALTALARAVERTQRRLGDLETLVRQLAADVTTLARSHPPVGAPTPAAGEGGSAAGGWLGVDDPEAAVAGMTDLVGWVEDVFLRYPDAELLSCWLWHPFVVEELWWLRGAHAAAYDDATGSWQRIGEWHDRYRPGVVKRLRAAIGGCELALHVTGETTAAAAPAVPLASAAPDIARAWTTHRRLPEPDDDQLAAAAQHDRAQHRKTPR